MSRQYLHVRQRSTLIAFLVAASLVLIALATPGQRAVADTIPGAQFVSATGRILDTRNGTGGYSTPMPANTWRSVQITGKAGIPQSSSVTAVALNFSEANPSGLGQMQARPNASTAATLVATFDGGNTGTTSNQADVAVNTDGTIQILANASTDLVIDVDGYYTTAGGGTAGGYVPIAGKRFLGATSTAVGATQTVQITGVDNVPTNATAVVADFIMNNQGTAAGYISPGPAGSTVPSMSLNYAATKGMATAVSAQVALSSDGKLEVWNRSGSTLSLSVDIEGYFVPGSATAGAFTAGAGRAYDSRVALNTNVPAAKTITVPLGGTHGIPNTSDGLSTVVIDLTVLHASNNTGGYARAWADGTAEPAPFSSVEYAPDSIRSNTMTVPVGLDGAIEIHNVSGDSVSFVVDIEGWYAGASSTLCAHDTTSISNVQTAGTADGVPTLSAAMTNGLGQSLSTSLYLQDANGNAIGGSPTATGSVDSGTAAVFHPEGLTAGASYTWWVHGSVNDACASQATSARQTFTVGTGSSPQLSTTTVTLGASSLGISEGPVGGSFQSGPLTVGTDGTSTWVSTMKVDFSSIPAGARVVSAVLHSGVGSCLTSTPCSSQTGLLSPSNADVATLGSPADVAAIPATNDALTVTGGGGDIDLTALVQSWYDGGSVTNDGAILTAPSSSTNGFSLSPAASLDITYAAPTVPSAPTLVRTTAGDGGLMVSWAEPADTGYTDQSGKTDGVSGYTAVVTSGNTQITSVTTSQTSVVINGLTNGTAYAVTVAASNPVGAGTTASVPGTPAAVPSGPSSYVSEVQKLTTAQTQLATGAVASVQDAAQGDATVQNGLGVSAAQLVEQSDASADSDQSESDSATSLSNVLVSYSAATGTATVFATVSDNGTITDSSDSSPQTIATGTSQDLAFNLTAGSTPTFVSIGNASALAQPVPPTSSDNLFVPGSDTDPAGAASLQLDPETGALTTTSTSSSASTAKANVVRTAASSKYVNVNYGGIVSWATDNAASSYNDGYPDDCTDFVSRAMYYGGGMHYIKPSGILPHSDSNNAHWYHAALPARYSLSWGVALDNYKFLKQQGAAVSANKISDIAVGDIIYVNWSGDGKGDRIDHAGVVVRVTSKNVYIAQHTSNRLDSLKAERGYHSWYGSSPKLYFWVTRPVETK